MARAMLLDATRTPFGRYRGGLSEIRVDDLAAMPITELVKRHTDRNEHPLDPRTIDEVIYGNTNGAGEENRDVARMAALLAGLPESVPGVTVNRLCGSGGEALVQAGRAVRTEDAELVVAGGVEGMSRAPFVVPRPERALPDRLEAVSTAVGWRLVNPRMRPEWTAPLGLVTERIADELGVGRAEMDEYALRSHRRAAAAWDAGMHDGFVFPVTGAGGTLIRGDESVRVETGMTRLAELPPAFSRHGSVTVGNSAPLGDGAVAALVGSQRRAERLGIAPLGELAGAATVACEPHRFVFATVTAIRRLLERLELDAAEVDLWEINEAFAALVLSVLRRLPEAPHERVNVHGGALAYGHPLGASMSRVVVDLCRHLNHRGGGLGIAATGVGVGQATAIAVRVTPET
ncbi:acetyl-CoA C-acyltransferase [Actinopolyspora erythraea]|uniref:Probable acetyl-CoA acetyltransferase n=1 Tax=Actinopolyspora erythraea TaxID=414996 RepID=A0A099DAI1_9ACTN|nr:thiolase family protein [Actinopolyspora erythraea]ASU77129.1 acetyl-CoA C-acyltransferase [Actinopolyspora erythraea]KGI83183.1 beta-ketoadipyl CoA thiolase [Actinopolyspora erythraea]